MEPAAVQHTNADATANSNTNSNTHYSNSNSNADSETVTIRTKSLTVSNSNQAVDVALDENQGLTQSLSENRLFSADNHQQVLLLRSENDAVSSNGYLPSDMFSISTSQGPRSFQQPSISSTNSNSSRIGNVVSVGDLGGHANKTTFNNSCISVSNSNVDTVDIFSNYNEIHQASSDSIRFRNEQIGEIRHRDSPLAFSTLTPSASVLNGAVWTPSLSGSAIANASSVSSSGSRRSGRDESCDGNSNINTSSTQAKRNGRGFEFGGVKRTRIAKLILQTRACASDSQRLALEQRLRDLVAQNMKANFNANLHSDSSAATATMDKGNIGKGNTSGSANSHANTPNSNSDSTANKEKFWNTDRKASASDKLLASHLSMANEIESSVSVSKAEASNGNIISSSNLQRRAEENTRANRSSSSPQGGFDIETEFENSCNTRKSPSEPLIGYEISYLSKFGDFLSADRAKYKKLDEMLVSRILESANEFNANTNSNSNTNTKYIINSVSNKVSGRLRVPPLRRRSNANGNTNSKRNSLLILKDASVTSQNKTKKTLVNRSATVSKFSGLPLTLRTNSASRRDLAF